MTARLPLTPEQRELFDRRAARIRRSAESQETSEVAWYAEFPVGEEMFAIPVTSLISAMPLRSLTPVPLARPELVGIFRHEGQTLPVLSLASLLGVRGWKQDPAVLLVLELPGGRRLAVDSEQIPKPLAIPAALIVASGADGGAAVVPIVADGRPVSIVHVHRLLEKRPV